MVANLLNCIRKKPYDTNPFRHLNKGTFPRIIRPTISEIAQELVKVSIEVGRSDLANVISEAYPVNVLGACASRESRIETDRIRVVLTNYRSFLSTLLGRYFKERLEFRGKPTLNKLPRFEVFELLVNDEYGLYGFQIHFSNGSSAVFARYPDSTECRNWETGLLLLTWGWMPSARCKAMGTTSCPGAQDSLRGGGN